MRLLLLEAAAFCLVIAVMMESGGVRGEAKEIKKKLMVVTATSEEDLEEGRDSAGILDKRMGKQYIDRPPPQQQQQQRQQLQPEELVSGK